MITLPPRLAVFFFGVAFGLFLYHNWVLPNTIDERAHALGMMAHRSGSHEYVPKPEHKWTLQYLKYGTMHTPEDNSPNLTP